MQSVLGGNRVTDVSDEEVNRAYNYLMSENLYRTKGVYASTHRNFLPRKDARPAEWEKFKKLVRLCKEYKYNLRDYVKFSLWHVLSTKQGWQDPSKLCTIRCISEFAKEKQNVERLSKCYRHIYSSVMRISELCVANGFKTFGEFMKWANRTGRLSEYIYVGTVSRYIVAMIPDIERHAVKFDAVLRKTIEEMVLSDGISELRSLAVDSIREYDRMNGNKGIFVIINNAIRKASAKEKKVVDAV